MKRPNVLREIIDRVRERSTVAERAEAPLTADQLRRVMMAGIGGSNFERLGEEEMPADIRALFDSMGFSPKIDPADLRQRGGRPHRKGEQTGRVTRVLVDQPKELTPEELKQVKGRMKRSL